MNSKVVPKRISTLSKEVTDVHIKGLSTRLRDIYKIKNNRLLIDTTKGLACLIKEKKDSIHAFIFKNIYKPAIIGEFDLIVGNPPWVVYSTISDPDRKQKIKNLIEKYNLQSKGKFNTSMEMATLFYVGCVDKFLKTGGTIAFVMPRSILQSSQHKQFRSGHNIPISYTHLYDMGEPNKVKPLFTIESCVLFGKKILKHTKYTKIPSKIFEGRIVTKNATWGHIQILIKEKNLI